MEHSNNLTISTAAFSILLFGATWFFYDRILDIILPTVNRGFYQSTGEESEIKALILLCFSVALVPVFIAAAWTFSPIRSPKNRLLSAFVILVCVIMAVFFRYQSIKDYFSMLTKGTMLDVAFPFEEINFDYYILSGLCIGFIISYAIFREKGK